MSIFGKKLIIKLSPEQKAIIKDENSCVVLGASGSGKTLTLIEKVRNLLAKGVPANKIQIATFSPHSALYLKILFQQELKKSANGLQIGTFRAFAQQSIENATGKPLNFSSERRYRRAIRIAMREVNFAGSIHEAEHIIRTFKSRANKPKTSDKFYELFTAFRKYCPLGRHDIVRTHIIGMREGKYKPCKSQYIFVDNLQDTTTIQLLWLFEQIKSGIKLTAFCNDDLCAFAADGATGKEAFTDISELEDIKTYQLTKIFKTAKNLGEGVENFLSPISNRLEKKSRYDARRNGQLEITAFNSTSDELSQLVSNIKNIVKNKASVGIITRHDWQAMQVERALEQASIPFTSLASNIWDIPGAIMMLDLLHVLLNQANDRNLHNVLVGSGVTPTLVRNLAKSGLTSQNWVKNVNPLNNIDQHKLPAGALKSYLKVHRKISGYYQLINNKEISTKDAFKALVYDMIVIMSEEDKRNALIAINALLSLKGDLHKLLPTIRKPRVVNSFAEIIIAPVHETRNLSFDWVAVPFANSFPSRGKVINDSIQERRLFAMALSRADKGIILTHTGQAGNFIKEFQKAL